MPALLSACLLIMRAFMPFPDAGRKEKNIVVKQKKKLALRYDVSMSQYTSTPLYFIRADNKGKHKKIKQNTTRRKKPQRAPTQNTHTHTQASFCIKSLRTFQEEEEHGGVEVGSDDHQEKRRESEQGSDGGDEHPRPVLPGLFPPAGSHLRYDLRCDFRFARGVGWEKFKV